MDRTNTDCLRDVGQTDEGRRGVAGERLVKLDNGSGIRGWRCNPSVRVGVEVQRPTTRGRCRHDRWCQAAEKTAIRGAEQFPSIEARAGGFMQRIERNFEIDDYSLWAPSASCVVMNGRGRGTLELHSAL